MNRYSGFDDYNEFDRQSARKILADELGLTADQAASMTTARLADLVVQLIELQRRELARVCTYAASLVHAATVTPNDMQQAAQVLRGLRDGIAQRRPLPADDVTRKWAAERSVGTLVNVKTDELTPYDGPTVARVRYSDVKRPASIWNQSGSTVVANRLAEIDAGLSD